MQKKTFAFKLSDSQSKQTKWKARDGVSVAGCTDPSGWGDYRYPARTGGTDNGVYC